MRLISDATTQEWLRAHIIGGEIFTLHLERCSFSWDPRWGAQSFRREDSHSFPAGCLCSRLVFVGVVVFNGVIDSFLCGRLFFNGVVTSSSMGWSTLLQWCCLASSVAHFLSSILCASFGAQLLVWVAKYGFWVVWDAK